MAVFEIAGPNGETFQVTAPDGASEADVLAYAKSNMAAPESAQAPPRGVMDKLLGTTGPRFQTFPERWVRSAISAAAMPGEVYQDAQKPPPTEISDSDVSPLGIGRALELSTMASPVNPMVRSGDKLVPGASRNIRAVEPKPPTATQLDEIADVGYKAVRNMGVEFRPEFPVALGQALERGPLASYPPEVATGTFGIVKRLQQAPKVADGERAVATFPQLEQARQQLREVARNFSNATDQGAAETAIRGLDDVLSALPEGAVVAGPAAAARKAIQQTRGDYAAGRRVNEITGELDRAFTGIDERAALSSGAAHSGRNYDNSLRQGLVSFLKSKKRTQGFTEEELAKIADLSKGAPGANRLRTAANFMGGGGGLGASSWTLPSVVAALATGNPAAAIPAITPAIGWALKSAENRSAKKAISALAEQLAKRSPLYEQMLKNAPRVAGSTAKNSALVKSLLLEQQQ